MKKKLMQLLYLNLFVLILGTSCTGISRLGFAEGEGDPVEEGKETTNNQVQVNDLETLDNSWSQMSKVILIVGGTNRQARQFEQAFNSKVKEVNDEHFAAAYASQKAKERSEEGSMTFAKDEENTPNKDTFYYMALTRHSQDIALWLSNIYKQKRSEGNSEAWAAAYARSIVLKNKTQEKAETFATTYADTLEAEKEKPNAWAHAYATMIAQGKSEAVATTFANAYAPQYQAGKSDAWAHSYASIVAQGKSQEFATTYTDTYESQLQEDKSADWAHSYASMVAHGYTADFAKTFADTYQAQLKEDKSVDWAHVYAFQIADGKTVRQAKSVANLAHPEKRSKKNQARKTKTMRGFRLRPQKGIDKKREKDVSL